MEKTIKAFWCPQFSTSTAMPTFSQSYLLLLALTPLNYLTNTTLFILSFDTDNHSKWLEDQLDVTDTVKTSLSQSLDTTEVFQNPRSEFLIWVERRLPLMTSHYVFTWFPTKLNNCHPKLWKLHVSVPTNILPFKLVENLST